ncbi:MAG: FeoA family protein [Erysipelotrichales bacterium]
MKLTDLKRGESAIITAINLDDKSVGELISLGFSIGNEIVFERHAPLGDPQQYFVAGNYIALRESEAKEIEVSK